MIKPRFPFIIRFWMLWELIAFLLVGYWIGYGWAFLLIVIGSLIGILLIRQQGFLLMKTMRENPFVGAPMLLMNLQSSLTLLSGLFFMIPGFLTDILAILCLLPGCRRFFMNRFLRMGLRSATGATSRTPRQKQAANTPVEKNIIEGEVWRDGEKKNFDD